LAEDPANLDREGDAQRALSERPSISIRARISIAFAICFLLICGITVAGMVLISSLGKSQRFLERAGNFAFEVQNARRYEKNFFLYGTNLYDGLTHVHTAAQYLRRYAGEMRAVVGDRSFNVLKEDLDHYGASLDRLVSHLRRGQKAETVRQELEQDLRRYGSELLAEAQEMVDQERLAVHAMMHTYMLAAIGALGFMFLVMIYFASVLTRQIVRPLGRFMRYTERIATGDYSPIFPRRRYRDEFSNLAMAFNKMLGEVKHHQEQLFQSRKMAAIGTLTSGIAHELNNPLNNIGLTAEALIEGFDDYSEEQKLKMLQQIYTQVERSSGTVRNLLDFTRKDQIPFASLSLAEVIDSTVRLVQNELTLGSVRLELNIPDNLPRVRGDSRNLQQVFLNLLLNAIQAMPHGGKLRVTASVEGEHSLRVDVTDTGLGISAEDLDKIFDPFFTTKEVGKGTGLGLSVSYGIIEKHHGRITVESEMARGTTFSVHLPHEIHTTQESDA